jgi:hypothetical protein
LSLSTLHREYAALVGLEYYDFVDDILQPQLERRVRLDAADIKRAMITYGCNEPQAEAILSAMQTERFSLIQGVSKHALESTLHIDHSVFSHRAQAKLRRSAVSSKLSWRSVVVLLRLSIQAKVTDLRTRLRCPKY